MREHGKRRYEEQPESCTVEGCGKPARSRGWCPAHYRRWRLNGEPGPALERYAGHGVCRVEGCDYTGKLKAGMCVAHHHRALRYGDPHEKRSEANGTLLAWVQANAGYIGDDCLIWPFPAQANGRGKVVVSGRQIVASRYMCILAHGEPPTPIHEAAHSCGKGHEGCMNPRHLRWDTPAGNNADKAAHGTSYRGQRHWQAKLTETDVRAIRSDLTRTTQAALAQRYGVDPSVISDIKRGKKWGWLK